MRRLFREIFQACCFTGAFCLLAWAAHAVIFNPPMLLTIGSSSVIDLGTAGGGAGAASAKVTIGPGGVPAGSTIVVLVSPGNAAAGISVTDTAVNTYVRQASVNFDSGVLLAAMFVCQNCAALTPGNIITFNVTTGTSAMSVLAIRTTQASSLNLNTTPVSGGKSTTPSITSGTPSTSGEIFVGGVAFVTTSPATSFIQAAGWTSPPDASVAASNQALGGGWLKNPGTSPQTYNPTLSAANFWGIFLMSFKL